MKQLIDFDSQFNEYMDQQAEKMLAEGKKPDEIEELIPKMYDEWAHKAAEYFADIDDSELVRMLGAYMDEEISVPDVLTDRITQNKENEKLLFDLFKREDRSTANRILIMNLLSDLESTLPQKEYLNIIAFSDDSELVDAAAEALKYLDCDKSEILERFDSETDAAVKERLMYILVYSPNRVEALAQRLAELMQQSNSKAVVAGLMAHYGDEKCLDALYKAEEAKGISYIDYVEICDAIEQLGGETDRKREFDGDDYYEMMHNGGIE